MIKVAIVDDHLLFRQGLCSILRANEELYVSGDFASAEEFIVALAGLDLDVLLLDIDMPGMSGIDAIPAILAINASLKIIMLTMHLSHSKIQEVIALGAKGYLLKTSNEDQLVKAIETVVEGKDYYSEEVTKELIASFKNASLKVVLTPREIEILKLVCEELSSAEIAEKLFISPHTAETHRKNILSKTGCKNSIGLVRYAIENGIISP